VTKPSGRGRHSFIQFYMNDWLAGTARMTRFVKSVYFDICVYNWDKAAPVPNGELALMLGDIDSQQADSIINMLLASGQLVENSNGIYSPRALAEAERALAAWRAKSEGGKKSVPTKREDTSKSVPLEPEPEPEPEEEKGANAPQKKARAKKTKASPPAPAAAINMIPELWNDLAAKHGLSAIVKMTDARTTSLKARVDEHGVNTILEAMRTIPNSRFLMGKTGNGWKANFDWLLQPSSCTKLIEGQYHNDGPGKGSAWTND
jgi:hypothetical protein